MPDAARKEKRQNLISDGVGCRYWLATIAVSRATDFLSFIWIAQQGVTEYNESLQFSKIVKKIIFLKHKILKYKSLKHNNANPITYNSKRYRGQPSI